ncbi:F-box protein [Musa troglodytarum]|uniref:F-box protein n=1 Tax=Musa troglodytarum TaxID=320322 RepID=A0A9E7JMY4_9LILI|nr:F-box protein [Musa troglodytarum]
MEIREDACVFSDLFLGNVREATAASPLPLSPSVSEAVPPKPSDPGKCYPGPHRKDLGTLGFICIVFLLNIGTRNLFFICLLTLWSIRINRRSLRFERD